MIKETPELIRAFEHIREFYPNVDRVVFFPDTGWCYMDEEHYAQPFGPQIDPSILEEAYDSVGGDGSYIFQKDKRYSNIRN